MIFIHSIKQGEITFNETEKKVIKYTKTNEYIYNFVSTLVKNDINSYFIEIELSNKIMHFDKKSIKTIMILLNNKTSKLLITNNFDLEKYKYKNFEDIDNSLLTTIKKNKIIVYDNENIVKEFRYNTAENEEENEEEMKILYINVFENNEKIHHENEEEFVKIFEKLEIEGMEHENETISEETLENIIYNGDAGDYKMKNENIYITLSFDDTKTEFIKNTYGSDLLPLLNNKFNITENNKLYRNKLYKNVLTSETCNWIITEYEKNKNSVVGSIYKNYENMLNLKNVPALISYILYFSGYLFTNIYNNYEIKNTNNFYPDEIFICKYVGSNTYNRDTDKYKFYEKRLLNCDNSVISINIQLNDDGQYIGNPLCILDENHDEKEIVMGDDDGIIIERGDAIVYNGRKQRTSGSVIAGSKYVLVIFLKLKI
jgi:hypothetical protein